MTYEEFYCVCKAVGINIQLERRGLIHCAADSIEECHLSDKGLKALGLVPDNTGIEEFVAQYREIFPMGIRSGGFLVKGSKSGCIMKMKKFLQTHPKFSQELIIGATKNYVSRKQLEGYKFMTLAHYFIEKDGSSQLEAECESLLQHKSSHTDFTKEI